MSAGLRVLDPVLFHPSSPPFSTDAPGSELGPPVLAGSRCRLDATVVFPVQESCPRCSGSDVAAEALPAHGTLWSWTVQHFAPKPPYRGPVGEDFEPFPLGYVDLGEIIVESRLQVPDLADLVIGMPLELSWLPVWTDPDGRTVMTYAFTPVGSALRWPR